MQKHINIIGGLINKSQVKVIFVDDKHLLHIMMVRIILSGIVYEPNMDLCLMVYTYQEKEPSSYVISSSRNYERDLVESSFS